MARFMLPVTVDGYDPVISMLIGKVECINKALAVSLICLMRQHVYVVVLFES